VTDAQSSPGNVEVSIKPMQLADGRTDYFVSIRAGDREVTPHVFREEYKAAYHVALYDWLLNGSGEEPDCVEFSPDDWPARPIVPAQGGWQPIETAPKDGTPVLVWFRGRPHVAEYGEIFVKGNEHWMVRDPATGQEDRAFIVHQIDPPMIDGKPYPGMWIGPTHWMPLPSDGPSVSSTESGSEA
jgi:hypothetical protein